MIDAFKTIARRGLFLFDAETAHGMSITALKSGLVPTCSLKADPRLSVRVAGLDFANPLGMAAGYDKNAEVPDALLRLGFNNEGHAAALARLLARRPSGIVGVNIGANKDSADRIADYEAGVRRFAALAGYLTVNISSPNTPGLRDLQAESALDDLIARVLAARDEVRAQGRATPILLKIAPDLSLPELDSMVSVALKRRIDGMIVSNTTVARPDSLRNAAKAETGGLSGKPLYAPSTRLLAETFLRVEGRFPLVGVGGIDSARTAFAKVRAGASLVQFYSAMVFKGPGLVCEIKQGLATEARKAGLPRLSALVGRDAAEIARGETL